MGPKVPKGPNYVPWASYCEPGLCRLGNIFPTSLNATVLLPRWPAVITTKEPSIDQSIVQRRRAWKVLNQFDKRSASAESLDDLRYVVRMRLRRMPRYLSTETV